MTADYLSDPLWLKLEAMALDEPGGPVPFSQRLSLEAGWTWQETAEATRNYKRFLYLMAKTGKRFVMPSRVEATWRQHLTYTNHYRNTLCRDILGFMLHHCPDEVTMFEDPDKTYVATFAEAIPHRVRCKKEFDKRAEDWKPLQVSLVLSFSAIAAALVAFNNTETDAPFIVAAVIAVMLFLLPLGVQLINWLMAKQMSKSDLPLLPKADPAGNTTAAKTPAPQNGGTTWQDIEAFLIDLARHDPQTLVEDQSSGNNEFLDATPKSAIEYGKFLYLLRVTNQDLTPSQVIDDVWHTHLMSTRSYWDEFCGKHLGGDLHHEPGTGRPGEMRRHFTQYCRTWCEYHRVFGYWPPRSHWPYPTHPKVWAIALVVVPFFALAWMAALWFGDAALLPGLLAALASTVVAGYLTSLSLTDDAEYFRANLIERSDRSRPASCG